MLFHFHITFANALLLIFVVRVWRTFGLEQKKERTLFGCLHVSERICPPHSCLSVLAVAVFPPRLFVSEWRFASAERGSDLAC